MTPVIAGNRYGVLFSSGETPLTAGPLSPVVPFAGNIVSHNMQVRPHLNSSLLPPNAQRVGVAPRRRRTGVRALQYRPDASAPYRADRRQTFASQYRRCTFRLKSPASNGGDRDERPDLDSRLSDKCMDVIFSPFDLRIDNLPLSLSRRIC